MTEADRELKSDILKPDFLEGAEPLPEGGGAEKKRGFGVLKILGILIVVGLGVASAGVYCFLAPLELGMEETRNIIVPKGVGVQEIAALLEEKGVSKHQLGFRVLAYGMAHNKLRAGEYKISGAQFLSDVVLMMRDGDFVVRRLTIPEGLTSSDILNFLRQENTLAGELDSDVPEEGSLLPETYHYSYGDDRGAIISRMRKSQKDVLNKLWEERDSSVPLASKEEAVVMASLIEKETGKKVEERARVAGVFYNRLKIGMRLQSDPTVIYAITKGQKALGRSLTRADLEEPSPFNTYTTAGLPPKPICNPGKASLQAALKPERHNYFYFVADGTGGHAFAHSLDEHNKNVKSWIKTMRMTP